MLIVDRDYREPSFVPEMTGQRFKVGDHKIDILPVHYFVELGEALRRMRHRQKILRNGALVSDPVIDVGETKSVDLGDLEAVFQVL